MNHLHRHAARPLPAALPTQTTAKLSSIARDIHAIQSRVVHLHAEGQRLRDRIAQAPVSAVSRLDWIQRQLQKT